MLEKVVFMIENISMMSVNFASLYLPVFFRVTTIDDIQLQQYYSSSSYLPSDPQSIYFTFWGRFRQAFCKKSATYVHQKCVHQSLLRIINWFMHIWCQKRHKLASSCPKKIHSICFFLLMKCTPVVNFNHICWAAFILISFHKKIQCKLRKATQKNFHMKKAGYKNVDEIDPLRKEKHKKMKLNRKVDKWHSDNFVLVRNPFKTIVALRKREIFIISLFLVIAKKWFPPHCPPFYV